MTTSRVFEPGATAGDPLSRAAVSPAIAVAAAARTYPPRLSAGLETQL
jgi:hypothetical protein